MTSTPPFPQTLTQLLADRIQSAGPITVADFMAEALSHPELGYYTTRDPFGSRGDFITAPEISQMFGEMIGLWCVLSWQMIGSPSSFVLAELGPGRGTLMVDLLRAANGVPGFCQAANIHLVETSPRLQHVQALALKGYEVTWCDHFDQLPDGPIILVANELFDALPVRQVVRQDGQWFERMVDWQNDQFVFVLGPQVTPELPSRLLDAESGSIAEICPLGRDLATRMGRRLNQWPGMALIIDYGHSVSAVGDTLQAVKQHRYHPVLDHPGTADLTAHVDFEALAVAAIPARAWGPVSQGDWLRSMGIEARAALLAQHGGEKVAVDIAGQVRRLTHPDEMGTLFKVLALSHPALAAPLGFV